MPTNETWLLNSLVLVIFIIGLNVSLVKQGQFSTDSNVTSSFEQGFQSGSRRKETKLYTYNVSSIDSSSFVDREIELTILTQYKKPRILYIITSLAEYNTGKRSTEAGSDRLHDTLIPVMREGVLSMLQNGFTVDVFLICHWVMQPKRLSLIREALPPLVKLEYWDDATPLGYKLEVADRHIQHITRALARQHRFVIKDKFLDYDFFVAFEDDMLIKGDLVEQNLMISNELERLTKNAPEYPSIDILNMSLDNLNQVFHGELTKRQLRRMMPGLIRVEVLLDEKTYPTQTNTGPIPIDLLFGNLSMEVNPEYCCHLGQDTSSPHLPVSPNASQLFLWETGIVALGVRKMPERSTLDWVVLQRGPSAVDAEDVIGDYWSGRHHEYRRERRPHPVKGMFINNMGGWMGSRSQIWNWHNSICPGGFLPPYDTPHFKYDGEDLRNVEYWSGGLHLVTSQHACNLQRIIPIDPQGFSMHLIYHTANNKQRQLWHQREQRFCKANTLLGQLNAVRKKAENDFVNAPQRSMR